MLFEPLAMDRRGAGLTALLVGAEVVALGAGRQLYSAGDRGAAAECAYVVKSGTVILTPAAAQHETAQDGAVPLDAGLQTQSGRKGQPQLLRRGSLFGVEAMLCDAPRRATAAAGGDSSTRVWAIRRELYAATVSAAAAAADAASSAQPPGEGQHQQQQQQEEQEAEMQWGGGTCCAEEIEHQLHLAYPAYGFLRRVKLFGTLRQGNAFF